LTKSFEKRPTYFLTRTVPVLSLSQLVPIVKSSPAYSSPPPSPTGTATASSQSHSPHCSSSCRCPTPSVLTSSPIRGTSPHDFPLSQHSLNNPFLTSLFAIFAIIYIVILIPVKWASTNTADVIVKTRYPSLANPCPLAEPSFSFLFQARQVDGRIHGHTGGVLRLPVPRQRRAHLHLPQAQEPARVLQGHPRLHRLHLHRLPDHGHLRLPDFRHQGQRRPAQVIRLQGPLRPRRGHHVPAQDIHLVPAEFVLCTDCHRGPVD